MERFVVKGGNNMWWLYLGIGFGLGYYLGQPKPKRVGLKEKVIKWLPNPRRKYQRRKK